MSYNLPRWRYVSITCLICPSFIPSGIFDAIFYASSMLDAILKVDGVVAAKFTALTGTPHSGSPVDITLDYQLQSGYFNYDISSTMTFLLA